jgi:hypothetical protein
MMEAHVNFQGDFGMCMTIVKNMVETVSQLIFVLTSVQSVEGNLSYEKTN